MVSCPPAVPLFETLDDLKRAPATITCLFEDDWYKGHINGLQECMIGGYGVRGAGGARCTPMGCRGA